MIKKIENKKNLFGFQGNDIHSFMLKMEPGPLGYFVTILSAFHCETGFC